MYELFARTEPQRVGDRRVAVLDSEDRIPSRLDSPVRINREDAAFVVFSLVKEDVALERFESSLGPAHQGTVKGTGSIDVSRAKHRRAK